MTPILVALLRFQDFYLFTALVIWFNPGVLLPCEMHFHRVKKFSGLINHKLQKANKMNLRGNFHTAQTILTI